MSGTLYIVGTPIGNLGDFSPRARQTLENADFIAAEDTRVTRKLLNHFDIHKETVSYFEHNQKARGEQIITRLLAGENCALVTDAGMPAISDPGQALVDQCIALGIRTEAVPGPVAFATALAVSGMENGRFTFEGFLSVTKKSRFAHLDELKDETRTMLFYEAPHKLLATLHDMAAAFGPDRKIALVRELTKVHEEVIRTTLQEAAELFTVRPPKGEFVLVIAGKTKEDTGTMTLEEAVQHAKALVARGMSRSEAAKTTAAETPFKKGDIYRELNR